MAKLNVKKALKKLKAEELSCLFLQIGREESPKEKQKTYQVEKRIFKLLSKSIDEAWKLCAANQPETSLNKKK